MTPFYLGIDVGSTIVKVAVTNSDFAQVTVEDDGSVCVLRSRQPSKNRQEQGGSGMEVRDGVTFALYEGAVLEVVLYTLVDQWGSVSENIFSNLHMVLMVPRAGSRASGAARRAAPAARPSPATIVRWRPADRARRRAPGESRTG
jgi:hypothetical protein